MQKVSCFDSKEDGGYSCIYYVMEYTLQTLVYTEISRIWSILCSVHFQSWQNPFSSHWPVSVQGSVVKITSFAGKLDHPAKWWSHFSLPSSVQDTWDYFLGPSAHHIRLSSSKLYHCDWTGSWHWVQCQGESSVCCGSWKLECSADKENIHEWVLFGDIDN